MILRATSMRHSCDWVSALRRQPISGRSPTHPAGKKCERGAHDAPLQTPRSPVGVAPQSRTSQRENLASKSRSSFSARPMSRRMRWDRWETWFVIRRCLQTARSNARAVFQTPNLRNRSSTVAARVSTTNNCASRMIFRPGATTWPGPLEGWKDARMRTRQYEKIAPSAGHVRSNGDMPIRRNPGFNNPGSQIG